MRLLAEYRDAKRDEEDFARLRRVLALRAMAATGKSQRQIAEALGITQPAVSQQLKFGPELDASTPEVLLEAAAPVLKALAAEHGYSRLAVFGSVARQRPGRTPTSTCSWKPPTGRRRSVRPGSSNSSSRSSVARSTWSTYGGLKPELDDDIRREAVLL